MAYVYQKPQEDDQQQEGQGPGAQATTGGGQGQSLVSDSGSGSVVPSGQGSGQQGAGQRDTTTAKGGTGWTNLQSYVSANQPEISRGAERVASDFGDEQRRTERGVESFGAQQAPAGGESFDDTFIESLERGEADADRTRDLYRQEYSGPESVQQAQGYEDVFRDVEDYRRSREALRDPSQLVAQRTPGANLGERSLDEFFYQQAPAQAILQEAYDQGSSVEDLWTGAQEDLGTRISNRRQQIGDQRSQIEDTIRGRIGSMEEAFGADPFSGQYIQDQNAARRADYEALLADPSSVIDPQLAGFAGDLGYDFERLFDYGGDVGAGDFLADDQVAEYLDYLDTYGDIVGAEGQYGGMNLDDLATDSVYSRPDIGQLNLIEQLLGAVGDPGRGQGDIDMLASALGVDPSGIVRPVFGGREEVVELPYPGYEPGVISDPFGNITPINRGGGSSSEGRGIFS